MAEESAGCDPTSCIGSPRICARRSAMPIGAQWLVFSNGCRSTVQPPGLVDVVVGCVAHPEVQKRIKHRYWRLTLRRLARMHRRPAHDFRTQRLGRFVADYSPSSSL